MIKSYITLALRNLVRNKLSSIINLVGLATAIGCSVVIFAFVHYLYNQDSFHENADAIFMVENEIELGGETKLWALAPAPLAPALKADFPQVKYAVRIENEYATAAFRYRDKVFKENFFYVDPEFLEMFTFRLKHGVKTALRQKNNIVLSDETAKKYFGDINPVGEQMALKYPNRPAETVTVAGVVEAFPANSSLRFCILMSYEKRRDFGHEGLEDWGNFTRATFIQLNAPDEIAAISGQVEHYIQAQNEARIDWHIRRMLFEPLSKAAINAYRVNGALLQGAPPAGAVAMGFMMISLLSLACFNYMNIAIGTATRRLKEIGLRKVVGGTRANLVKQFLSENIVLCLIALCMGVVLAQAVFLPGLNSVMSNFGLRIPLTLLDNLPMWYYLGALLLLTGIGAGLYPALYISKFKPVAIFQGKQRLGGRNLFTRLLLTAQFVFSFMTIFAGFTVNQNVAYQRSRDWGYNQAQTIVIPLDEEGEFEKLKNIVGRNSNVVRVAGSVNHIGANSNSGLVKVDGKKYDVRRFQVGYDYPETMGMRLAEGRFFDRAMITDLDEAILVNKTFAREANLAEPLGKTVTYDDRLYNIVGVVEDYHYRDFYSKIEPVVLQLAAEQDFQFMAVRVAAGTVAETAVFLESTWRELFPDSPYQGFFQDSVFDNFYRQNSTRRQLAGATAVIALLLSCMGLFGLTILNISKRIKEFGIRKVLGASIFDITKLINREFVWLLSVAVVIAAPLSFILMNMLLDAVFVYRVALGPSLFVVTAGSLLLTAVLTVSSQIYRVAVSNPVDSLRVE